MSTERLIGGSGMGRTDQGCQLVIDRLAQGMSGSLVAPDIKRLRHAWERMKCMLREQGPNQITSPAQVLESDWMPHGSFTVNFKNGAKLWCLCDPEGQMGLNVHFSFLDGLRDSMTLKLAQASARIAGPSGQEPAVWYTWEEAAQADWRKGMH
jgi:hypothetical protein